MSAEPSLGRLHEGVVETLETAVLPELPRGGAARRQLNAALDLLRRLAFAAPRQAASLDADNRDIAETIEAILPATPDGEMLRSGIAAAKASPDREAQNAALQAILAELQERGGLSAEATAGLRSLYRRMLAREMALIPPPRHAIKDKTA